MLYIIYIALGYLTITSIILLRNRFHFTPLHPADTLHFDEDAPKVSICIPARNEERNIRRCVESMLNQSYPNLEVLVLNDQSTDGTESVLLDVKRSHSRAGILQILTGKPKPDEWLGKPWSCQQLAEAADGDILVFADADTWAGNKLAGRVVRSMGRDVVDMVTVWPRQELGTVWEKMIIPLVYYALISLLPVQYVYRAPRWMPSIFRKKFGPLFAAACGQFMAFKVHAYQQIGGHQSVKDEVVEDVALAQKIKKAGYSMRMYYGSKAVSCRMYRSADEVFHGFRKNFLAGFGYNIGLFLLMGFIHLLVYIVPPVILIWSLLQGHVMPALWSALPVALMLAHRFMVARWFGWNPFWGLLHPASVAWFQWLAIVSLKDYLSDNSVNWKGRPV